MGCSTQFFVYRYFFFFGLESRFGSGFMFTSLDLARKLNRRLDRKWNRHVDGHLHRRKILGSSTGKSPVSDDYNPFYAASRMLSVILCRGMPS